MKSNETTHAEAKKKKKQQLPGKCFWKQLRQIILSFKEVPAACHKKDTQWVCKWVT